MALDKDILGMALYNVRTSFDNKSAQDLIDEFGSMEDARTEMCKREAEAIIDHFISNIQIDIPGTGLAAPEGGGPVTGDALTGTIQ